MPECRPDVTHAPTLLGGAENMKLLFDSVMQNMQLGARASQSHSDAWETFRLTMAHNREAYYHAINMGSVLAGQAGVTEQQQTVSPIRTASGDNLAAGAVPSNRATDVAAAAVATANAEVAALVAKFADAMTTLLVDVISQTQPARGEGK